MSHASTMPTSESGPPSSRALFELAIFFALTLSASASLATLAYFSGDENIAFFIVFSPTLIAICLTAMTRGKAGVRELLIEQSRRRFKARWLLVSLLAIPAIAIVAIGLHAFFGGPALAFRTTQLMPQCVVILLIALGEEFGWRGYALPRLQEHCGPLLASLVLGLAWGFWHYPGYLIGVGVPLDMPFDVFLLWVLLATILITCIYNQTGNIWTAVALHAAANATFNYLPLLPEFIGQLTTFLIFLALLSVVVVTVCPVRRSKTGRPIQKVTDI